MRYNAQRTHITDLRMPAKSAAHQSNITGDPQNIFTLGYAIRLGHPLTHQQIGDRYRATKQQYRASNTKQLSSAALLICVLDFPSTGSMPNPLNVSRSAFSVLPGAVIPA